MVYVKFTDTSDIKLLVDFKKGFPVAVSRSVPNLDVSTLAAHVAE